MRNTLSLWLHTCLCWLVGYVCMPSCTCVCLLAHVPACLCLCLSLFPCMLSIQICLAGCISDWLFQWLVCVFFLLTLATPCTPLPVPLDLTLALGQLAQSPQGSHDLCDHCVVYFSGNRRCKLHFSADAPDPHASSPGHKLLTRVQFKTMSKGKHNKVLLVHVFGVDEGVEEGKRSVATGSTALPQVWLRLSG